MTHLFLSQKTVYGEYLCLVPICKLHLFTSYLINKEKILPFIMQYNNIALFNLSTSWAKQRYTRGAYTAIAVGACQDDMEYLAQPLYSSNEEHKVRNPTIDMYIFKKL